MNIRMSESWEICCSDEEKYDVKQIDNGKWEPYPEDIFRLYGELEKNGGILEISWKCPGRRPPTPEEKEEDRMKNDIILSHVKVEEKDEYVDFEIEKGQLCLRPSGDVGPRGSAKKKTTCLDDILMKMERHRRMDMMEEDPPETL